MASKYNIKNINRRIKNIKERDLPLITLKAPSQAYSELFYRSGTEKEGEIVPYRIAKEKFESGDKTGLVGEYTQEMYKERLQQFIDINEKRLNVRDVTNYAYNLGLQRLESSGALEYLEEFNISSYDIEKLSKTQFMEMMKFAGSQANEDEKLGYGSDQFYEYLVQWWEENKGIKDY